MKVICMTCKIHLSGSPNDPEISHGLCHTCRNIYMAVIGGSREARFFDCGDRLNQCIVRVDDELLLSWAWLVEHQRKLGRGEWEFV